MRSHDGQFRQFFRLCVCVWGVTLTFRNLTYFKSRFNVLSLSTTSAGLVSRFCPRDHMIIRFPVYNVNHACACALCYISLLRNEGEKGSACTSVTKRQPDEGQMAALSLSLYQVGSSS